MDCLVLDARDVLLGFHVLQAVRLVPAGREDVERDLSTDGITICDAMRQLTIDDETKIRVCHSREAVIGELFLQRLDQGLANVVHLVITRGKGDPVSAKNPSWNSGSCSRFKLISLLHACVTADRADVDHAVAELNKGPALLRQFQIRHVSQHKVGQILIFVFAQPLDEAVAAERLAQTICGQSVLGEAEVEERGDINGGSSQLLLLLDEV